MASNSKVEKCEIAEKPANVAKEVETRQEDENNPKITQWPTGFSSMSKNCPCIGKEKAEWPPNVYVLMEMWKWKDFPDLMERVFVLNYLLKDEPSDSSVRFAEISSDRLIHWKHTELNFILRNAFPQTKWNDVNSVDRLRRCFAVFGSTKEKQDTQSERKFFSDMGVTASIHSLTGACVPLLYSNARSRISVRLRLVVREYFTEMCGFVNTCYNHWVSGDSGKRWLCKLTLSVPKYSQKDREEILNVLAGKRDVTKPETYLERLFDAVGKRRFDKIVFGRMHRCATCGATNRGKWLRGCQKCELDRLYPKRRYCDVECQKIDWPKHREEHKKHSETNKSKRDS